MKDADRSGKPLQRPEAKTQRGVETRDRILLAARELVCQRWVDEIPFVQLARTAQVARASLLHAFPQWRDVLTCLFTEEVDRLDQAVTAAMAIKGKRPADRVYAMLCSVIDRAEATGLLYANLRAMLFTCQGELSEKDMELENPERASRAMLGWFHLIELRDQYDAVEELLEMSKPERPGRARFAQAPIGELLVHWTLDLAAGIPSYGSTFDERRSALRDAINLVAAGLRASQARGRRRAG
jgi:AcrR family transcriptional regulator